MSIIEICSDLEFWKSAKVVPGPGCSKITEVTCLSGSVYRILKLHGGFVVKGNDVYLILKDDVITFIRGGDDFLDSDISELKKIVAKFI